MGGSAPAPDPQMGVAARMSAETGQRMLSWMQEQARVTNNWASQDRARYQRVFQPMEDRFAADARAASDPRTIAANASARSREAVADVRQQFTQQRAADTRRLTAMGVNPNSGRFAAADRSAGTSESLAAAGAANMGRRASINEDRARADGLTANAINLGKGMAVNPATSMGLSNSAGGAGFQGAMSGYGQQASILNTDYNNRMQAWQADQGMLGGLFQGIGVLAGLSSKGYKTDKKAAKGNLEKVRKMPVGDWKYKPGIADGGAQRHIGPYAEDFKKATGVGDGKTIDLISQLGVTLGAIQELDKKVSKLEGKAA